MIGFYGSRNGIFPSAYVEVIDSAIPCTSQTKKINQEGNNTFSTLAKEEAPQHTFENSENCQSDVIHSETTFNVQEKILNDYLPNVKPNSQAKVLYNFDAQMNCDISVKENDIVCIIEVVNEDWYKVQNEIGEIGLCPRAYLCLESDKESGLEPLYIAKSYNSKNVLDMQSEYFREANTDIEEQNKDRLFCPNIQSDSHNHTDKCLENSSVAISPLIDLGEELLKDELGIDLVQNNEIERNSNQSIFFGQPDLKDELQSKNLDIINTMKESLREDGVDLREKKIQNTLKGHEELSRVVSVDRIPHRPAPPIPLPGQQPVRRHLHRPSPTVSGLNKEEFLSSVETEANPTDIFQQEEQRLKNIEQRQNVISELVYTEKEYVRDLKITYETFNLHNPTFLERRGIDVQIVFGNLLEVLNLAEDFLDLLQLAMKGKSEEDQCVGSCFLQVADKMKLVYGLYCMNHDNALTLFEKYESNPDIKAAFDKGLETLRYQIVCFDMSSILIKPVQRILKYPLIINELIKCTEDNHKDKQDLLNAVITMMEVASYINEYKRRNDIVTKYLDIDDTISNRMSKISLHSVAKKSTRIGFMLSSSLGIKSATKDLDFDEQEKSSVERRVMDPLNTLLAYFDGPEKLVQKRNDKLLDYDGYCARADKLKDNRQFQEELAISKSNYEALNWQLLEELPILTTLACELFVECMAAFVTSRRLLSGKITKQYLTLMESNTIRIPGLIFVLLFLLFLLFDLQKKETVWFIDVEVWIFLFAETQGFLPIFCLMPEIDTQPTETQPCISSLHETKLSIPTVLVPQHQHHSRPSSLSALELSPNSNETSPVQRVSGQLPSYEEVVLADISEDCKEDDSNHIYEEIPDNVEYFYALYHFVGNGEYMLTVQAGQVVKVLHKEDFEGNPEWWLVENHVGNAIFSSSPTPLSETGDSKHSPMVLIILAKKRPTRVTSARVHTALTVASTEHVVSEMVVFVNTMAHFVCNNGNLKHSYTGLSQRYLPGIDKFLRHRAVDFLISVLLHSPKITTPFTRRRHNPPSRS
uniref:Dynamin-binding protein n=1 Tax=Timema shepardi TaxID=629360 RepID=A0A7R9AVH1_TIMSH|nr:unnamed protein product [Timema shepardi]